jgi:hypothetical protein
MRPSRRFSFLILAFVFLSLATATTVAAQDVRHNFMPGTDFSKYHTYKSGYSAVHCARRC